MLAGDENPHRPLIDIVGGQLGVPVDVWELYAERDATRRSHLLELLPRLGMEQFGTRHYRSISAWLDSTALQTTRGIVLAQTVVEELRRRLIVLPPVAVIERLCAEAMTRAQRKVFALLTEDLSPEQRIKLDQLLEQREGSRYSALSWLRMPPGAPTPRALLGHIERLNAIRDLGFALGAGQKLHQNRLLQLAREAGQTAVYQLKEYEQARRHGTLVALMIETAAALTDEIVDLNDRLIGSFFTKSKNKYERAFAEQGKAINDKVRLYAKVGAALVDAREQGHDPFAAIEAIVPWDSFSASVKEAAELARDQDFDALSLIGEHYPQLRRYAPALIETLQLRPAPVARELIEAVEVLREMNRDGLRKVPQHAPLGFIRRRWEAYVLGPEGIDRRFYELCVMAELKNSLRSGDVSVAGSRQSRDFEDYLMPHSEFDRRLTQGELHVAVPTTGPAYIEERMSLLRSALARPMLSSEKINCRMQS